MGASPSTGWLNNTSPRRTFLIERPNKRGGDKSVERITFNNGGTKSVMGLDDGGFDDDDEIPDESPNV